MRVYCPYCSKEAKLVDSIEIYKQSYGMIYLCKPCEAYVGCHFGTDKPKGSPAKKELRVLRMKVHNLFDPLWQRNDIKRSEAYRWLQEKMNMPKRLAHIGMFNEEQCKIAISLINQHIENIRNKSVDKIE